MVQKLLVTLFIIKVLLLPLCAQEMLIPLKVNPVLYDTEKVAVTKTVQIQTGLTLPFKEDFSYPGPYPNSQLWADNYVFVNSSFALNPKTYGTATFDLLNQQGQIYPQATESSYQFRADMLTSHPIRLDSVFQPAPVRLTPGDSIMLSFYYQPQGKGAAPRERDTLVLEFLRTPGYYAPDTDNPGTEIWIEDQWDHVWSATGKSLNAFVEENNGQYFRRVVITIEDQQYFRNDFRFRFRNYGSFPYTKTPPNFAGNAGIWNIDYITLDYGRSANDPFYYDIAFAQPAQSILRKYQSMPWSHYIINPSQHLRQRFNNYITNLDNQIHTYSYNYFIQNRQGNNIANYFGGTRGIAPFHTHGYQDYALHSNPVVVPNPLTPLTASQGNRFRIKHVIRIGAQGDENTRNDTIIFNQVFDNYFAYDDGIPETGYGLVGNAPQAALRFVLSHPDQLTSVNLFFNPTLNNQNQRTFYLRIWKNLDPETILYQSEILSTQFEQGLSQYINYPLREPLEVSDTIYVGWAQTSNDFLNVGFDLSNNSRDQLFFKTHGQWLPSIQEGALMLRPVFGESFFTNVPQIATDNTSQIRLYPNPVKHDYVRLEFDNRANKNFRIQVFDTSGRIILTHENTTQIDVANLANGLYFISLSMEDGTPSQRARFLISR
jgi:hypothetical protein